MAHPSWLQTSLQRSGSLGLEVLERASRRSVDWTNTGASQTPTTSDEDYRVPVKRPQTELDAAFATIAEFMEQTTYHCRRFYESGCCTKPTESERTHMSRFHTQPGFVRPTSALPTSQDIKDMGRASAVGEDFYIEVSPGTYSITASLPASQQQTQVVSIKPGQSIDLTFNL